ncbi:MAG: sialidase family protein [bacterium]
MSALRVTDRVVLDRRADRYFSFPDVTTLADGRVLAAYRTANVHYPPDPASTFIRFRHGSRDGLVWSEPWELAERPANLERTWFDCPRLRTLADGTVAMTLNLGGSPGPGGIVESTWLTFSHDGGRTWEPLRELPLVGIVPDRVLIRDGGHWIVSAHYHVPSGPYRLVQKCILSDDAGRTWSPEIQLAGDPALQLCEVSLLDRGAGRIDAFLREDQGIRYPTLCASSFDGGRSFGALEAHPSRGHRITTGLLPDGRMLATYRNVAGLPATCGWLGSPDARGAVASGVLLEPAVAALVDGSLVLDTEGGGAVEFGHDPIESLAESTLAIEAEVRVLAAERCAAVLRGGAVLRLTPDQLELDACGDLAPYVHAVDLTCWRRIRLTLTNATVAVALDGRLLFAAPLGRDVPRGARVVAFGNAPTAARGAYRYTENAGRSLWRSVAIEVVNPRLPGYRWCWSAASGRMPDHEEREHQSVLWLESSGQIFDHGYTGWTLLHDGHVLVVNYARGADPKPVIHAYRVAVD